MNTAAMTGAEHRHTSKSKDENFRQEQEKQGFKNISIFLSEKFIAELDRLKAEKGMSRQAAMEYVFDIYEKNVVTEPCEPVPEKPVKMESEIQPIERVPEPGKMAELNLGQKMEVVDAPILPDTPDVDTGDEEIMPQDPAIYKALDS